MLLSVLWWSTKCLKASLLIPSFFHKIHASYLLNIKHADIQKVSLHNEDGGVGIAQSE
jgi:hypothetical protein